MLVQIYTDGSCHPQQGIGGWAAIILLENKVFEIKGFEKNTTHNAMEILAVLKALDFTKEKLNNTFTKIEIISDSQYVIRIKDRMEKLKRNDFQTKKNQPIRNAQLVKSLIEKIENLPLIFTKIKAHQKVSTTTNYNRIVDKLARNQVRNNIQ